MMKKRFYVFALCLLMTPPCSLLPAMAQEELKRVHIDDYSGGMNSKDFPDTLQPNQGTYIANAIINKKGMLSTRLGQALQGEDVGGVHFNGLGTFYYDPSTSYLISASGVSVVGATENDKTWTILNPSNPLTSGLTTNFIQANSLYFVMNGTNPTSWTSGLSATWVVGGTWPGATSPPTATTAAWLNNYLFLAGNSLNPDWVYISDNLIPQSFQANQVIKVNSGDGQPIKRLEPYRTSSIIIYKTRSIYQLDISGINSSCSPQPICQWSLSPLTLDVGTPAPYSVVNLGNDQWFLSSSPAGVRALSRTQFDKLFVNLMSAPIQDIFDGTGERILNTTLAYKSAAIYYDNKYLLAIPTGSSTVNDLVLVYDFITQSWYLIDGWYPAYWTVVNNNLYYADANTGRVVKCFSGTTGDFGTIAGTSVPTVGIKTTYTSKIIDFDVHDNFKQLDAVDFDFTPTGNYFATVYINQDNSGWTDAGTVSLVADSVTLPVNLPFILKSPGYSYQTLQLTKYGEYKKIQVKLELQGTGEQVTLQKISIYSRVKPWRRVD